LGWENRDGSWAIGYGWGEAIGSANTSGWTLKTIVRSI